MRRGAVLARPIRPEEAGAYEDLAARHGSLFVRREWTALFGDDLVRCGLFDNGGALCGGFQLFRERRFGLTVLRDAPFTPECGPFLRVEARHPVAVLEARREALAAMAGYLRATRAPLLFLALHRSAVDCLPFMWRGFKVVPVYTYTIDLGQALEAIQAGLTAKRRNDITKAERDGLVARRSGDLVALGARVGALLEGKGKNPRRRVLDRILTVFANENNSFAFGTYRGEELLASCFVVHDGTTAYYLLGSNAGPGVHHGAGALAMLAAIRHARDIGCRVFDFEGSVIPPVERYFRGFGGSLQPYFTVNRAWFPIEVLLKLTHRELF